MTLNLASHAVALLETLAAYLLMAAAYVGWGELAGRFLHLRGFLAGGLAWRLWLGWATVLFFLQVWHLAAPIGAGASVALHGVGVLALATRIPEFVRAQRLQGGAWRPRPAVALAVAGVAVWLASRSMMPPGEYDSGLYHFNTIRWLKEHPIVPGLGNLHGRLAFNQSFFAYVAALDLHPWLNRGHAWANSFLMLALAAEGLWALGERLKFGRWPSEGHWLGIGVLLLPWVAYLGLNGSPASPSPDTASAMLQAVIFLRLWGLIECREARRERAILVLTLAAASITVKLSNLGFAVTSAALAIGMALRHRPARRDGTRPRLALAIVFSLLHLGVWSLRGAVLSGYPAYPSTFLRVEADWAVPTFQARQEADRVRAWARWPGQPTGRVLESGWEWLGPWSRAIARDKGFEILAPLAVFVSGAVGFVIGAFRRRRTGREVGAGSVLLASAPPAAGLLFWFLSAPDPRFVGAQFWILAVTWVAAGSTAVAGSLPHPRRDWAAMAIVALPFALWLGRNPRTILAVSLSGFQPTPVAVVAARETASGLTVYVPVEGDQLWDSPLPATPRFDRRLRLRGSAPDTGFTVRPPEARRDGSPPPI